MDPIDSARAPREARTVRRVLLVGMQRSGTTVTQSLLTGLPSIAMAPEEIHTSFFQRAVLATTERGETPRQRSASMRRVFDELAGRAPEHTVAAVKTALPDAKATAHLAACLAAHADDFDLVVVRRRDLLAQLASLRRAQATGIWHRRRGDDNSGAELRIVITEAELADYVQTCVDCDSLVQQLLPGRRALLLDYAQHVVGNQVAEELARFLEVELPTGPPRLRKASPPASHYVVDHDRLAAMVPTMLANAQRRPPRPPEPTDIDSRVFLLHRARVHLKDGEWRAAVEDALAAIDAPPDWGIASHQWSADTLAEALTMANELELARRVTQRIAGEHDPHLQRLAAHLRSRIGPD